MAVSHQKKADGLVRLVTKALNYILNDQYEVVSKKPFQLELGTEIGPGAARTSKEIEDILEKFLPEHYSPETARAFLTLKKNRTRDHLSAFLEELLEGSAEASRALSELENAPWDEILIYIDSYIVHGPKLPGELGRLLVKEREGVSSPAGRKMEAFIDWSSPGFLSLFTVRKYTADFKDLFPGVVGRAERLRLIPVVKTVPNYIRRYLGEASRCFIYGQFLASILLCRSAIVAAAEDRLRKKGFGREVDQVRQDFLKNVLKLALNKGLLDETIWKAADEIRVRANKAAHSDMLPDARDCMEAYHLTRGIIQHLYE